MPPDDDYGPDDRDYEATPEPRPAELVTTVKWSATSAQLVASLAKAQAEMCNPVKDAANPHFKSMYADLAAVRDAVLPVLGKHGLAVLQLPCETLHGPALVTRLMHESGEWVETTTMLRPFKLDPQGVGSALTYRRRYDLQSIAGVAGEDDDGNAASGHPPARQQERRPEPVTRREARGEPAPTPTVEVVKGDPETDAEALTPLLTRKGYGWADLVQTANKRFLTNYSISRTGWLEFPAAQRKDLVARLNDLPDKTAAAPADPPADQAAAGAAGPTPPAAESKADPPGETVDSVSALLDEWSKVSGASTTRLMSSVVAEVKSSGSYLNKFTAEQLRAAATYIRNRIFTAREQRKKVA